MCVFSQRPDGYDNVPFAQQKVCAGVRTLLDLCCCMWFYANYHGNINANTHTHTTKTHTTDANRTRHPRTAHDTYEGTRTHDTCKPHTSRADTYTLKLVKLPAGQ